MAIGDHIKVARMGRFYTHHGINMGDGTVVHFSGEPLRAHQAKVIRSTMDEFLAGGRLRVVAYRDPVCRPEEVVAMAEALLASDGYCVFRNNCEHFARFCKTGQSKSVQVRRLALFGGATVTTVAWVGLAVGHRLRRILQSKLQPGGDQ